MDDNRLNTDIKSLSQSYVPRMLQWDKYAAIRTRSRRVLSEYEINGYFYPIDKQPICDHPIIKKMGPEAIEYILIQAAYKFMSDLAFVEVEMVNGLTGKIYNKTVDFNYTDEMRQDALTIIIDEAHHALIANDYMDQMENYTKISPIKRNIITELAQTVNHFRNVIPSDYLNAYNLICVCIGENTFTQELFLMARSESVNQFYHDVMTDHMFDEGRHQAIFGFLLKYSWLQFDEKMKIFFGELLPAFILDYLKPNLQIEDDRLLLQSMNLSQTEIERILSDIHVEHTPKRIKLTNPVFKNLMKMLERTNVLEHANTKNAFVNYGLL